MTDAREVIAEYLSEERTVLGSDSDDARMAVEALTDACPGGYIVIRKADWKVMGTRSAMSIPPIDCSNACMDGTCDCSGEFRTVAWDFIEPEETQ